MSGSTEQVWVLLSGALDSDGDPFNPEAGCPPGAGGVVKVFRRREDVLEYVENNPALYEDQPEPLEWKKWKADLTWWCGPLTHQRGYRWLSAVKMRLER